ncbi:MAG: CxxC-x17-CxxC domain-containing protein [Patescibacteria group bacterium]|jgi:CxxC-x17-CxxC domain-containing protein
MPEPNNNVTIFGETNYRNARRSFGIKRDDRRRHMYVIGKTGMGKTTLLENLIISDILNGEGCCYIDPHGDTAEKLLDFIPPHRINDVIYLNPADAEFPIAFNVLEAVDEINKNFVASGLISVFKKLWADSWGPRLEYILRNTILSLLDYPGSTLLGIMRILVEKDYREKVVAKIKDPVVRSFWVNEYSKWNEKTLQEVISPIQNKVGQFLSNFLIRNIVGQVTSTIDLREIMDNKKILILNLAKGKIGEDTMKLLGSMIVTKLYLAAMSRVDILEKDRPDFYLYVDEFQNFATESFANILSEARKYRLNLIVAHQYIEQLPEEVAAAVFGNVGTLICFRVGAADAEKLVLEFAPFFTEEDLVNLPAFAVYLKLMIDGVSSDPFSAATLPPLFEEYRTNNSEKVTYVSRERYANPRAVVEDKINRWSSADLSTRMGDIAAHAEKGELRMGEVVPMKEPVAGPTISLSALGTGTLLPTPPRPMVWPKRDDRPPRRESRSFSRDDRPDSRPPRRDDRPPRRDDRDLRDDAGSAGTESRAERRDDRRVDEPRYAADPPARKDQGERREFGKFDAKCSMCGKMFKLNFQPEKGRPVYCNDCFKKVKDERRKPAPAREPAIRMLEQLVRHEDDSVPPLSLSSLEPRQPLIPPPDLSGGLDTLSAALPDNPPADEEVEDIMSIRQSR